MSTTRKVPLRQCVGCQEMKNKKELLRVIKTPENEIVLDATGRRNGRGAYLCPSTACLAKARKAKRLQNAFGVEVPDEVFDRLTAEIQAAEQAIKEAAPHE